MGDDQAFTEIARRMHDRLGLVASKYFGWGLTRDDLYQEALIGAYKATKSYKPNDSVPFEQFAYFAAKASVVSAVRTASALKHGHLNESRRLDAPTSDGLHGALYHVLAQRLPDPAWLVEMHDLLALIGELASDRLSDLERRCLGLSLSGVPIEQVAAEVGRDGKSVDNALRRGRAKLRDGLAAVGWERDETLAKDGLAPSGIRRRLIDRKRKQIGEVLESGRVLTKQEIADEIGCPVQGLHKLLDRMERRGEVVLAEGLWQKPAPIDPSGFPAHWKVQTAA
jgi:RNA polymerase sporulation-specific sigma factor